MGGVGTRWAGTTCCWLAATAAATLRPAGSRGSPPAANPTRPPARAPALSPTAATGKVYVVMESRLGEIPGAVPKAKKGKKGAEDGPAPKGFEVGWVEGRMGGLEEGRGGQQGVM